MLKSHQNKLAPQQRRRRQEVQTSLCCPRINRKRLLQLLFGTLTILIFYVEITLFNQLGATQDYVTPVLYNKTAATPSSSSSLLSDNDFLPVLPIFSPIPNAENLIASTLKGRPTMAGIIALIQKFISELHDSNTRMIEEPLDGNGVIKNFYLLAQKHFVPFDKIYRGKSIFPIRNDDSIFLSLAAFREHLLADTLLYAFSNAKNPEKLFIGAVVQNCFGKVEKNGTIDPSGKPCKTGARVIGKRKNGKDITDKLDSPIDKNGIEDFCAISNFKKYCTNGQIRVLYVHEHESLGPAMARYYASKLWGGETFFVQADSHLKFAFDWDEKYRNEIKLTRSYPKSVLSSYPPGFNQIKFIPRGFNQTKTSDGNSSNINNYNTAVETPGCRLCRCNTPPNEPNPMLRINLGPSYKGGEPRPTQIPFIAAGFFFTRSEFLKDIPFDPFLPWTFMGEEISLSMRAWTSGWDIYAPRKNLIVHQYRPPSLGIPKYWSTVNQMMKKGFQNNYLQGRIIRRVKNLVGYPGSTTDKIETDGSSIILTELEHYGLGSVRSWDDYMKFTNLTIDEKNDIIVCHKIEWCNKGGIE